VPSPCHGTFGIAGHAGPADLGTNGIDQAGGRHPDPAGQRGTAVAVATHARSSLVDEFLRNEIERGVILGGKARPVGRMRAAGAARLARAFDCHGRIILFHARWPNVAVQKSESLQPASSSCGLLNQGHTRNNDFLVPTF
jgi:hypothetical protein